MNTRKIGTVKEQQAAKFLEAEGYRILEQNFRCPRGEIDLIASRDGILVFVEVKYRAGMGSGAPEEAVNAAKQRRIIRAATQYLAQEGLWERTFCRFDAIAICGEKFFHYIDAFQS